MKYLERFEYFCRECEIKGTVLDVLLNPDVLLIRGYCPSCKKRGTYKVVDIEALREEHATIAREAAREASSKVIKVKWELRSGATAQGKKPENQS